MEQIQQIQVCLLMLGGFSSSSTRTPDSTSTWYTTNDATFEITGVQLEEVLHAFEHLSKAEELALCQREIKSIRFFMNPKEKLLFVSSFVWFLHWGVCLTSIILDTVILRGYARVLPLGL